MKTRFASAHRSLWNVLIVVGLIARLSGEAADVADQFCELRHSPSWKIALVPHTGPEKLDEQIRKAQSAAQTLSDPRPHLERLGWLFVAKARSTDDPGFYKIAEHCALALQTQDTQSVEALLLRGHILQALHRFKEAEAVARQLVVRRELAFDHGLLGDALADQGILTEAIGEYQRMIDLRPDLQSYSRVAHVRWLKGDLEGAIKAAELAVRSATPLDSESAAWVYTRLANYQFQANAMLQAENACHAALSFVKDYPPALLLRGRMLLAAGSVTNATECFRRAVGRNPLPEYQWAFADALHAEGKHGAALTIENELKQRAAANDPRTFALYLATQNGPGNGALRLAERELETRQDIFTYDALAWALFSAGRHAEAWKTMERALAEGTHDARLFLHAGCIAARLGRDDARFWLNRARAFDRLLLPSERRQLEESFQILKREQTTHPTAGIPSR